MARWFLAVVSILLLATSSARARDPGAIFDFFARQLENEINRQQQREHLRRQQQLLQQEQARRHERFLDSWRSCFDASDLLACDQALAYPSLAGPDRQRLLAKRQAILDAAQQERRRAELEAERDRQRALQAHRDRVTQTPSDQAELIRTAAHRALAALMDGCRAYVVDSCTLALQSSVIAEGQRRHVEAWRSTALAFANDRKACADGDGRACDRALASPAVPPVDRDVLFRWRAAAATPSPAPVPTTSLRSEPPAPIDQSHGPMVASTTIPASTVIAGLIAAILAIMLIAGAVDRRLAAAVPGAGSVDGRPQPKANEPSFTTAASTPTGPPSDAADTTTSDADAVATQPAPAPVPVPGLVRDTPAALANLELAAAYLKEVADDGVPALEDEPTRKRHLDTLALASRKLQAARRADPDAVLEGETAEGEPYRLTRIQLEADALFREGLTHQVYDTRRALPALAKACELDPHEPAHHFALGLFHAANMNRPNAIAALQKAVALDPGNIEYRKELDRAESITEGEILAFKATRAAETVYDAGIATANAGIRVYNAGVICWNIFAFTYNTITFPLRLMLRVISFLGR